MKRMLNISLRFTFALCLGAFASAVTAQGRQAARDLRVISAKAGGVNLVAGGAEMRRSGEKTWLSLTTKDNLEAGDAVRTAAGGRVEVLLNPGSYWRAGSSTEFFLENAGHEETALRLEQGSAVVEATGFGDFKLNLIVITPQTRVRIERSGVYRLTVLPTGETLLAVEKGRAFVGDGTGLLVKGGKLVRVGKGTAPEVSKFDKKMRDEFDLWSRERGKELARANEKLSMRQTNAMLANLNFDRFFDVAVNPGNGFWFWNTASNCYTFLSFYPGWRSPYGFGYRSWFYSPYYGGCGGCPPRIYQHQPAYAGGNPVMTSNPAGGGGAGNGGAGNGGVRNPGGPPMESPRPTAPPPVMRPPAQDVDRTLSRPAMRQAMDQPNQ